jgi:hypothetical protein
MDRAKTYAVVGFIAVVAIVALYTGTRRTVIRGHVIAAQLHESLKSQGEDRVERIECDDEIPIGFAGAKFECTLHLVTHAVDVEYEMARDGSLVASPLVTRRQKP